MRLRIRASALLLPLTLLAGSPALAERLVVEPSGHILVPVTVNGAGPFDFVLDTCASQSTIHASLPERLGLQPLAGGYAAVHGASGTGSVSLFHLDGLVIDGRASGPMTAPSLGGPGPAPRWAGIIGADILSAYVVELDAPGGTFRLLDPATDLAAQAGWTNIPFTLNPVRFPILDGTLDERPVRILFDTGARRSLINWAAARQLGISPEDPDLRPAEPVRGATPQQVAAMKRVFREIRIGGLTIPAGEITIADLPVFDQLGMTGPALILGMDRMRSFRFAVDYPRSRLLVARSPG